MSSLGIFDKETKTYKKVADLSKTAVIDTAMSGTSTNPVQNKVIKAYVDKEVSENVDFSTSTSKSLNDTFEAPLVLSKATRNLLIPDLQTVTINGITCTNNGDGTYTFNGTATDNIFFDINKNIPINKGIKYKFVFFKDEDYVPNKILSCVRRVDTVDEYVFNNGSFVSETENCWVWASIVKDVTVSNLVAKPMLTTDLDATYDDFVPYSGYDIKTCGKNLLNLKKVASSPEGITASLSNGIITLDGSVDTSDGWKDIYFGTPEQWVSLKRGVKYTISTKDKVQKVFILLRKATSLKILYTHDCYTNGTTFVASEDMVCQVTITFKESSTFNNMQIAPQIEVGEKATDFEPYQDGGTVHIDSSTEFPLLSLKSFDGETNIISPGNVEVTYAKSDSGKAILDMSENKLDKDNVVNNQTTTEEGFALDARQANPNVEGSLGAQIKAVTKNTTVNLLNPTLETTTQDGITCTNNGDGTYTLNGTVSTSSNRAIFVIQHFIDTLEEHLNEELLLVGCPKHDESIDMNLHLDNGRYHASDRGNGSKFNMSEVVTGHVPITIEIGTNGTTVNNLVFKPMITTNLNATYDDFVPYTGDTGKLNSDVAGLFKKAKFERNNSVFSYPGMPGIVITGDTAGRFGEISVEWFDTEGRVIRFKNEKDEKTHITIYAVAQAHSVLFLQAYSPNGASVEVKSPLFFYNESDTVERETIACDVTAPVGTEVSIAFNPIVIKNV